VRTVAALRERRGALRAGAGSLSSCIHTRSKQFGGPARFDHPPARATAASLSGATRTFQPRRPRCARRHLQ
jgi:hypothetical protein